MIFATGPLLAAANRKDRRHADCVALLRSTSPIRVPGPVIAEAGFTIGRIAGARTEASFLRSLSTDRYEILNPAPFELRRAADLVARYESLDLGTTDAIVMAMAEFVAIQELRPSTRETSVSCSLQALLRSISIRSERWRCLSG